MDVTALPFHRMIGLVRSERADSLLSLPAGERYTNHLGTVHASALLALAEASSGEFMLREFGNLGLQVVPVVRRLEAKFRKPANGAVHSRVSLEAAKRDEFLKTLREKKRALIELTVDVSDEHGAHVLSAQVEWFVAQRP